MTHHPSVQAQRDFKIFFPVYVCYLAPILYNLFSFQPSSTDAVFAFESPTVWTAVLWLLLLTTYFFTNNLLLHCFGGTVRKRSSAARRDDLLRMYCMDIPLLSFARIHNRLKVDPISFGCMFMFFGVFYTVLFEFGKKLDIVATPQHIFGNLYARIIVTLTSLVVVWNVLHTTATLQRVTDDHTTALNIVWSALLVIGVHCVVQLLPSGLFQPNDSSHSSHVHLHHWWWSYLCAGFCILSTAPSTLACAMFVSCHVHGLATFGCDPIYNAHKRPILVGVIDDEARARLAKVQ